METVRGLWKTTLRSIIHDTSDFYQLGGSTLQSVAYVFHRIPPNIPLTFDILRLTLEVRKACQCSTVSISDLVDNPVFSSYAIRVLELLGTSPTIETRRATQAQWLKEQVTFQDAFNQFIPQKLPSPPSFGVESSKPGGDTFLLGVFGAVGSAILAELLKTQAPMHVYCLVESESVEEGRQEIISLLKEKDIWSSQWAGRVIPVVGNGSAERFGLSESAFSSIAENVWTVIVCPESHGVCQPYSAMEGPVVRGTKEAIRLALSGRIPASVHLISSLSVFGESTL